MDYCVVRGGSIVAGPGPSVRKPRSGEKRLPVLDRIPKTDFTQVAVLGGFDVRPRSVYRVYVAKDLPIEEVRGIAHGILAEKAKAVETDGVTLEDGTVLDTSPESRSLMAAELLAVQLDPSVEPEIREKEKAAKMGAGDVETAYLTLMKHVRETNALAREIAGEIDGAKSVASLRSIVDGLPGRMQPAELPYQKAKMQKQAGTE